MMPAVPGSDKEADLNKNRAATGPKQVPLPHDFKDISAALTENEAYLRQEFTNHADIVFRDFYTGDIRCLAVWIDGLINERVSQDIFHALMLDLPREQIQNASPSSRADFMNQHLLPFHSTARVIDLVELKRWIMMSKMVLLIDGCPVGLMLDAEAAPMRSIAEPSMEASVAGPRDCFVEPLRINTALIRSRLGDSRLKSENYILGRRSNTLVNLMYIEDIARPEIVEEARQRIERIDIDGMLDSNYLKELIQDEPFSLFPLMKNTERPDKVAADLLEGKFALIVDGSPMVLTAPCLFGEFLQAADDHYNNPLVVWLLRFIRYVSYITATTLPGVYVAVTTYHQEMIPIPLVFSIAAARQSIPFPTLFETMLMLFGFELLSETGIRLPRMIGPIGGMLGALIMGQIAIMAGFVSSSVAIVVAITAVSNFVLGAGYALASPIRLIRMVFLLAGGALGLYGINLIGLASLVHLTTLRSFGVSYLAPWAPLRLQEMKDLIYRAPRWDLTMRPALIAGEDLVRSNTPMPSPSAGHPSSRGGAPRKRGEK